MENIIAGYAVTYSGGEIITAIGQTDGFNTLHAWRHPGMAVPVDSKAGIKIKEGIKTRLFRSRLSYAGSSTPSP